MKEASHYCLIQFNNDSGTSIQIDTIPCLNTFGCVGHANHCRQTIFSGNNGSVRQQTAYIDDQTTGIYEQWSPPSFGNRGNEDLTCLNM